MQTPRERQKKSHHKHMVQNNMSPLTLSLAHSKVLRVMTSAPSREACSEAWHNINEKHIPMHFSYPTNHLKNPTSSFFERQTDTDICTVIYATKSETWLTRLAKSAPEKPGVPLEARVGFSTENNQDTDNSDNSNTTIQQK